MNDSAFKSILDGYNATRVSLNSCLTFWTWLVVIGVAFEVVFIFWSYVEEKREWQKALIDAAVPMPEGPNRFKLICELLSVVLVVAGIIGELQIEVKLGRLETDIQDINEKRVLQLQKEAGDAATSSAKAQDSADKANAAVRDAQRKVRSLAHQTTEAETSLADEERKRLEMESIIAPRELTLVALGGGKTNWDRIRPFSNRPVIVQYVPDAEVSRALMQVLELLRFTGYHVLRVEPKPELDNPYFDGVVIQTCSPRDWQIGAKSRMNSFEEDESAKDAFLAMFKEQHWEARSAHAQMGELKADELRIIIGFKPNPSPGMKEMEKKMAKRIKQ